MLLFARLLVVDGEVAQGAAAQVARVKVAHGVFVALAVGRIMCGMGMRVPVSSMDIETGEAGEGSQRIGQHLAGVGAEPGVEFGAQAEPALAFE